MTEYQRKPSYWALLKKKNKGRLTVKEQSGKVQSDRAVRESTQRQSSQEMYKVTEQSGKVHGGRLTEQSGKVQSDGTVRKVHNDSTVRE